MEPNILLVSVISARGLYLKGHSSMDALVTCTMSGKSNLRSRAVTDPIHTDGDCRWNEHMEFQINEPNPELIICAQHKSRFGRNDVIGRVELALDKVKTTKGDNWYPLRKKSGEEKYRGEVQLRFEFRREKSIHSVSNHSLNSLERKDSMIDKIKNKIRKSSVQHRNDPDDLSFASSGSQISDASYGSKKSKRSKLSRLFGRKKRTHEEDSITSSYSNEFPAARSSSSEQDVKSMVKHFESFTSLGTTRSEPCMPTSPLTGNIISSISTAESFVPPRQPARSSSATDSGINVWNQAVTDERQELLAKVSALQRAICDKDARICDLEKYMDNLLIRVMEKCPEILAAANGNGRPKTESNRRFFSTFGF